MEFGERVDSRRGHMNCRDCLYCKFVDSSKLLHCKMDFWNYVDGDERYVKLRPEETNKKIIHPRGLFTQAERCPEFSYMGQKGEI